MEKKYVLDENGRPKATPELCVELYGDAGRFLSSAKSGQVIPYVRDVAERLAEDDYKIRTLIEWLGGVEAVVLRARDERDWFMRDVATSLGAKLTGSGLDFPPKARGEAVDTCDCWEGVNDREGKRPCEHERLPSGSGPFENLRTPGICRCGADGPPWKHTAGCAYK